jgi:hypothetical protein
MQTPDGAVFEQIAAAVRASGKALVLDIGADDEGVVRYEVSNANCEGVPLKGWEWGDPEVQTSGEGPTLESAWRTWQEEAARQRSGTWR